MSVVLPISGRYNIKINQYATYKMYLTWKTGGNTPVPINNTGYKALLQVRSHPDSPNILFQAASFGTNKRITLEGSNGRIVLKLSYADTAALKAVSGVYDLLMIEPSEEVHRIIEGEFIVLAGVTKYDPRAVS